MIRHKIVPEVEKDIIITRVHVDTYTGCWNWIGAINKAGYGRIYIKSINYLAHRISFKLFNGELIQGLVIDHMCRNRKCVNPKHLRQVTQRTNTLENSESVSALNYEKIYCENNHELSGVSIKTDRGYRECLICKKNRNDNRPRKTTFKRNRITWKKQK